MFEYTPANRSSIITPHPPGRFWDLLTGKGFRISKILKRIKPIASDFRDFSTANIVMRNPQISSMTILRSSSPHTISNLVDNMVPPKKTKITADRWVNTFKSGSKKRVSAQTKDAQLAGA